jgi:hypothetical protein
MAAEPGLPRSTAPTQTGTTLSTKLWTGSNPVLKAGDIIRIAGLSPVYDVTADAPNTSGGITALSINPPIFAGASPGDGAAISYVGVRLNAKILSAPDVPQAGPNGFVAGLSITFREAV